MAPPPPPVPAAAADDSPRLAALRLTRVDVDPSLIVDDPAADWCRHEIRRVVAWRLVQTASLVGVVTLPVAWWATGSAADASGLAVAVAAAAATTRWAAARVTAPLGGRYLRTLLDLPPDYVLAFDGPTVVAPGLDASAPSDTSDPAETSATPLVIDGGGTMPERHAGTADVLRELGFRPNATVRSETAGGRVVDLYVDDDRIVVAVDRTSASTTVLTELVGFRVLVTSALLVPPTDELVVNVVTDGDTAGLVLSHQRLVRQAFRSRTLPSEPVGLFKLAQQREFQAYRDLGPRWGSLVDLRCRPRGVRLLAAPSAGEVLLFTGNKLFRQTTGPRAGRSVRTAPAADTIDTPASNGPTT
ncbi:MAG: hypothetical protein U0Q03_18660 [Acidimicrobiales bacterium]